MTLSGVHGVAGVSFSRFSLRGELAFYLNRFQSIERLTNDQYGVDKERGQHLCTGRNQRRDVLPKESAEIERDCNFRALDSDSVACVLHFKQKCEK